MSDSAPFSPVMPIRAHVLACLGAWLFFGASAFATVDFNGNGMNDVWEQHFAVPADHADEDYTGNGLRNRDKSLLGLDPRDPDARFVLLITRSAPGTSALRFQTVFGKMYRLEATDDFRMWEGAGDVAGDGSVAERNLPDSGLRRFYRSRYVGEADLDGDGLSAWDEWILGSNDQAADSENDGLPDLWEFRFGLSLTS